MSSPQQRQAVLRRAIEDQLESDILSHEWILELARFHNPNLDCELKRQDILSVLSDLVVENKIMVGPPTLDQEINAWPIGAGKVIERLRELLFAPESTDHLFDFWIGKDKNNRVGSKNSAE